jgi:hypothetical protein
MQSHWPIILVEGVMVFGGALVFGWWQLRSIRIDREKAALRQAERLADELANASAEASMNTSAEGAMSTPKASVVDPGAAEAGAVPR